MNSRQAFELKVLPHLDAAYNLARWLLRDDQAAEDAVQDAALRAMRYIDALQGEDGRPWLLGIVRNTCFSALARARGTPQHVDFDTAAFEAELATLGDDPRSPDPATELQRRHLQREVDAAIRALSPPLREVVVLREFEDLDYAQIARIAGVPIGTVMSRLARAREKLRAILSHTHPGA